MNKRLEKAIKEMKHNNDIEKYYSDSMYTDDYNDTYSDTYHDNYDDER